MCIVILHFSDVASLHSLRPDVDGKLGGSFPRRISGGKGLAANREQPRSTHEGFAVLLRRSSLSARGQGFAWPAAALLAGCAPCSTPLMRGAAGQACVVWPLP